MAEVNLKLSDANTVCRLGLSKDELAAGWPVAFTLGQLAWLQRPVQDGDRRAIKLRASLWRDLTTACEIGELAHTTSTVAVRPAIRANPSRNSFVQDWGRGPFEMNRAAGRFGVVPSPEKPAKAVTVCHVAPAAFGAWLKAKDEKPSRHTEAWFDDAIWRKATGAAVDPSERLRQHSPDGVLRFINDTPASRLVRLAEVVRWLMKEKELPCKVAVAKVCAGLLTKGASDSVYMLNASDWASKLGPDDCFLDNSDKSWWEKPAKPTAGDAGLEGAVKYMREYWGESTAPGTGNHYGQHLLEPLAIRLDIAIELWGYGVPIDVEASTESPATEKKWDGEALRDERDKLKQKHRNYMQQLAAKSGVSEREIRRRIAAAPASGNQYRQLVRVGKKV